VVAGNIGSSSYMNYTIIGDTVNIAARLCQRARAGEMLFSGALKQSLDAHGMDVGGPAPALRLRGAPTHRHLLRAARNAHAGECEAGQRLSTATARTRAPLPDAPCSRP